ncbi:unnamed protein product [Arctogadus glacialis]
MLHSAPCPMESLVSADGSQEDLNKPLSPPVNQVSRLADVTFPQTFDRWLRALGRSQPVQRCLHDRVQESAPSHSIRVRESHNPELQHPETQSHSTKSHSTQSHSTQRPRVTAQESQSQRVTSTQRHSSKKHRVKESQHPESQHPETQSHRVTAARDTESESHRTQNHSTQRHRVRESQHPESQHPESQPPESQHPESQHQSQSRHSILGGLFSALGAVHAKHDTLVKITLGGKLLRLGEGVGLIIPAALRRTELSGAGGPAVQIGLWARATPCLCRSGSECFLLLTQTGSDAEEENTSTKREKLF